MSGCGSIQIDDTRKLAFSLFITIGYEPIAGVLPHSSADALYFAILRQSGTYSIEHYCSLSGCRRVAEGYAYNSGTNPGFPGVEQLIELFRRHVDPDFTA